LSIKRFFSYRAALLGVAVVLAAAALATGLSISGILFGLDLPWPGLGSFLVASYGGLALAVPAYLLLAALILADPAYRPDRIFALTCTIVPFLTLAAGTALLRDYERAGADNHLLGVIGKNGFSLAVIALASVEILGIIGLTALLFPAARAGRTKLGPAKPERKTPPRLLPPPPSRPEPSDGAPPRQRPIGLPMLKPLASVQSFLMMEEGLPDVPPLEFEEIPLEEFEASRPEFPAPGPAPVDPTPQTAQAMPEDADLQRAIREAEREAALISAEHQAPPPRHHKPHEKYHVPVEDILTVYPDGEYWIIDQATRDAAVILKETLKEFNIQAEVTGIRKGPVITMFEILPAPGVKLSRIVNLQDNIALRLAASSVRIVAPIPGKHAVGIEVPNHKRNIVSFREMIEGELRREGGKRLEIPVVLGKDISGEAQILDLVQTPHILIAGATGSGKSVCVNSMILSILYQRSPGEVRLILIDPKIVELKLYNDIPHLLTPVITEPKRAFQALQYCIFEMERRYALLDSMGVRDIRSYNRRIKERSIAAERIPYIVVVIDEFADLMATTGKELESTVARLAAMSRAVGIHLVLATQRPSIDVITGLIKANIPSRIAFMVAGKMDSRIIIDMVGAEKLLGKGDMLYSGVTEAFPVRMQGAFVSEEEVERVVDYVRTLGEPDYIDEEIFYDEEDEAAEPSLFGDEEDPLYDKALEIVMQQGKASASYIQRRLKVGYNRAARLVELMEDRGIVGPAQGSKPRDLLRGQ